MGQLLCAHVPCGGVRYEIGLRVQLASDVEQAVYKYSTRDVNRPLTHCHIPAEPPLGGAASALAHAARRRLMAHGVYMLMWYLLPRCMLMWYMWPLGGVQWYLGACSCGTCGHWGVHAGALGRRLMAHGVYMLMWYMWCMWYMWYMLMWYMWYMWPLAASDGSRAAAVREGGCSHLPWRSHLRWRSHLPWSGEGLPWRSHLRWRSHLPWSGDGRS